MQPLYTYGDRTLYAEDFSAAFRTLGVTEGDTIFVHSDIMVFGKLAAKDKEQFLSSLVEVFKKSVGQSGTVIMPTFNNDFCRGAPFDKERTRSSVGALTEYFRHYQGVIRNAHPIFSVAAWGRDKDMVRAVGKDALGKESIFDTLHQLHAKIIMFGAPFETCTFLHHIEQMHAVPYRFFKTFRGVIINDGRTSEDECTYFVRPLDGTAENDMTQIERVVRASHVLNEVRVGGGKIALITSDDLFDAGMSLLDKDPYAFLKERPHDV